VDTPEPQRFAEEWISAWDARDVDAVLTYYAEDVQRVEQQASDAWSGCGGVHVERVLDHSGVDAAARDW
jgi:hypothetical protein